jgi:hypothetical protein
MDFGIFTMVSTWVLVCVFFFPGEISSFLNKEIGKILDFFFSNVNSTNFYLFMLKFAKILEI